MGESAGLVALGGAGVGRRLELAAELDRVVAEILAHGVDAAHELLARADGLADSSGDDSASPSRSSCSAARRSPRAHTQQAQPMPGDHASRSSSSATGRKSARRRWELERAAHGPGGEVREPQLHGDGATGKTLAPKPLRDLGRKATSAPSTSAGVRTSVAKVRSLQTDFTGALSCTARMSRPRARARDRPVAAKDLAAVGSSSAARSPRVITQSRGARRSWGRCRSCRASAAAPETPPRRRGRPPSVRRACRSRRRSWRPS